MEQYHAKTKQKNQDIIDELALRAEENIGKVIASYDINKPNDQNSKLFGKESRPTLLSVADYLKVPGLTDRQVNKTDIVKGVMSRIANLLLEPCRRCNEYYNVGIDERPTLSCMFCGQGCHSQCYDTDAGNLAPGLFYICISCEDYEMKRKLAVAPTEKSDLTVKATSSKVAAATVQVTTEVAEDDASGSQSQTEASQVSPQNLDKDSDAHVIDPSPDKHSKAICRYFRRDICRHGITGKQASNSADGCKYFHPVVCPRSRTKGKCNVAGCTKFHPKMCYTGINTGKCYKPNCRYWHLSKVVRHPPREHDNSSSDFLHHVHPTAAPHNSQLGDDGNTHSNDFLAIKKEMLMFQQQLMLQVSQMFKANMMAHRPQSQFVGPPVETGAHYQPPTAPPVHQNQWANSQGYQPHHNYGE